jgi:hypothetical protein
VVEVELLKIHQHILVEQEEMVVEVLVQLVKVQQEQLILEEVEVDLIEFLLHLMVVQEVQESLLLEPQEELHFL